jgi:hypothetical protein
MKAKRPDPAIDEIELHPDAWERFERALKKAAKASPHHRTATQAVEDRPAKKKRGGGARASQSGEASARRVRR